MPNYVVPGAAVALILMGVMVCGAQPQLYVPEQVVTKLKPLYPDTPLVKAGKVQATIIAPQDKAYAPLYQAVADKVKAATGAAIPVKTDDQYAEGDKDGHLICLGQMMNNKLAFELYVPHYVACDDWYPGPEGYVVRTVCDPWGKGTNVIMLGGSDLEGVQRAVDRFCDLVKPGADLVLPRLIDIGLKDKEKMAAWLPGVRDYFWSRFEKKGALPYGAEHRLVDLARKYHLTGEDVFAEVLAEGIERWLPEYYRWEPHRQITTPKYIIPEMILDWDLLEEHPAFSDDLRLEYTNVLYDYVSRMGVHGRITQLKPGFLATTGHHKVSLTVTRGGRYFKTYYPDLPMDRIDAGLASVQTGLDTIKETFGFFDENGGYTKYYPLTTMLNSVFLDDMHYFTGGTAREWLHQSLIYTDNLGSIYCGWSPAYEMGEWFYRDGKWAWLNNVLLRRDNFHPEVTEGGLYVKAWSYLPKTEPVEPTEWLEGVQWLPIHETVYAQLERTKPMVNVPREKTYHVLSMRPKYDPDAEYLRLDGINDGISHGGDGNAIVRLTAQGKSWLVVGKWGSSSMKYQNSVIALRDGQMVAQPVTLCSLECAADLPSCGLVQSVMSEYNGTDWARNIIWLKGGYFVVADVMRVREAGDFSFLCRWRTSPGELEGSVFHALSDDRALDIASAGGCQIQTSVDEGVQVFSQGQHGRLAAGEERTFINLLRARSADEEQMTIARLSDNVAVVSGPEQTALVGAVLPRESEMPATQAGESLSIRARAFHLTPTRLCAADLTSLNWTAPLIAADKPVSVELDLPAGKLSVLAQESCKLEVLGESIAVEVKPGEVQTVQLAAAERDKLVRAISADLKKLSAASAAGEGALAREPQRARSLWSWANESGASIRCAACGDLDGDGAQEVAVGAEDGSVSLLSSAGDLVWSFAAEGHINDVAVDDVDGDGQVEVLAASDDFNLYCLTAAGKEKWRFNDEGIEITNQAPGEYGVGRHITSEGEVLIVIPVDLDGDGNKEILVGTKTFVHGNRRVFGTTFCLDGAGKLKWHLYQSGGCVISMDAADVDGDGVKEVAIGVGGGTYGRSTYLIDSAGGLLARYGGPYGEKFTKLAQITPDGPVRAIRMEMRDGTVEAFSATEPFSRLWGRPCGGLTACGPVVADLDGDGFAEILLGSSGGSVYALNEDEAGQGIEWWRTNLMEPISALIAADVLGDESPVVIAASQAGGVHVLDGAGQPLAYVPCGEPVSALAAVPGDARVRIVAGTVSGKALLLAFE